MSVSSCTDFGICDQYDAVDRYLLTGSRNPELDHSPSWPAGSSATSGAVEGVRNSRLILFTMSG